MVTVISVEPTENYKLRIVLSDKRKGIFDVSPYLDKGLFHELTHLYHKRGRSGRGLALGRDENEGISALWHICSAPY